MNRKQRRAKTKTRKGNDHNMVRMLAKANIAADTVKKIEAERQAQRSYWMALIAVNDAFGIGKGRVQKYLEALEALAAEYIKNVEEGDQEYADEKLRMAVERVTGEEIMYLYDDERIKAEMEAGNDG